VENDIISRKTVLTPLVTVEINDNLV